jgi:hypothetical protein
MDPNAIILPINNAYGKISKKFCGIRNKMYWNIIESVYSCTPRFLSSDKKIINKLILIRILAVNKKPRRYFLNI